MYIPEAEYGNVKKKIIIFSGAGISAPSGISTFRDSDGTWENHNVEDVCNVITWKKNFELVHKFYNERREQLGDVQPNIAHKAVKEIIDTYGEDNVFNITQNVDDLFDRIDCPTLHLHGFLPEVRCEACGNKWDIGYNKFNIEKDRCPKCDSLKGVKPNIVFFGESAPMYKYMKRAFGYLHNKNSILIVIGTMGNVVPIEDYTGNLAAKKILCNLDVSVDIEDKKFDKVYYESIESAIHKIKKDIKDWWELD